MGEFTIQCTMCDSTFATEDDYNKHGCSEEDVKMPIKIKLEPGEEKDEDDEMEQALLNFTAEFATDINSIKLEEPSETGGDEDEMEDQTVDQGDDPLNLKNGSVKNEEISNDEESFETQFQDRILNETEIFSENYTHRTGQEEIITGGEKSRIRLLQSSLENYSCNCKICGASFSKKIYFLKHFREEHKTYRPYECEVCKKKFLHKHYVNLHMRVHTGERPYKCTLCPRSYSHKTSFTIHMRIHNGERPYGCGVCGKKCYDKSGLTSHMRSHTKETPYQCEVCGRRFTHSKSLLVHRRNHTGEKPYICSYCGKAFRHWHKHKIHVRLHTGERPYRCKICNKGFPRNDEVSRHMRSHQGIKSFKCSICGVYCATQASITGHINLHHSNLKTSEMEPPPEKTLVKDSTSGILGTKVPEQRSTLQRYCNRVINAIASGSKSTNDRTKSFDSQTVNTSTRVIEVTSKDTPITIPSNIKMKSKKVRCILPTPKTMQKESESKPMNYQEFLEWQERMLANQGLVVKGYPSTSKTDTNSNNTKINNIKIAPDTSKITPNQLITSQAIKKEAAASVGSNINALTPQCTVSTTATGVAKPQYLLLSQGGDGGVTKILLPINMVNSNSATKTTSIPKSQPKVALPSVPAPNFTPTIPGAQGNRPVLLLPEGVSSQPLLLVSNGGQRMLLMASTGGINPAGQPNAATNNIVIKQEPTDFDASSAPLVTIKREKDSPPPSPKAIDIKVQNIKQEPA